MMTIIPNWHPILVHFTIAVTGGNETDHDKFPEQEDGHNHQY